MSHDTVFPAAPATWPDQTRKLLAAAATARRRYPGPVGELLHRELMAWQSFGHRLGRDGLIVRLLDELGTAQAGPERLAS